MEIPVLIEPVAGNGYIAKTGEPLALTAEGATRQEAISKLRELLSARTGNGSEVMILNLPGKASPNPWVEFAGMFKDDPYFDDVVEIMAENRRKMDAEPDAPMIQFVLDTDTVTLYQRGHPLVLQHLTDRDDTGSVAVSIISVEEQLTGWYTRLRQANGRPELAHVYQRFTNAVRFLSALEILTFGEAAIERFENLRKSLRNIGKNDLRIAAIALEHNATVVTRNRTDFQRIPGLSIEDWSK